METDLAWLAIQAAEVLTSSKGEDIETSEVEKNVSGKTVVKSAYITMRMAMHVLSTALPVQRKMLAFRTHNNGGGACRR